MHTLLFLDPGHFHAALLLRERHPQVRDDIVVYAADGPELRAFLDLVEAFNRRGERPTAWRPRVRTGSDPLGRLIDERGGETVVVAGKNDGKAAALRRLHDAGLHVLADKPWLVEPAALDDVRRALTPGSVVMELLTGHHDMMTTLQRRLAGEPAVFGAFPADAGGDPAIEMLSVHHLEKQVNGAPLRRPPWFFDVRVQGDGVVDIPTHLVDQVQHVCGAGGEPAAGALSLVDARRWATRVPREAFRRMTGAPDFPADLRADVDGDTLVYACNAEIVFRCGGVLARLATRWELAAPPGGGDRFAATLGGTRATIRVEQGPETGFRKRLAVEPGRDAPGVGAALDAAVLRWGDEFPGLALRPAARGFELTVPEGLDGGHESHFPLVLREFLRRVEGGVWPRELAARTLAKYTLLAEAAGRARAGQATA